MLARLPAQVFLGSSRPVSAQVRPGTRGFVSEPLRLAGFVFTEPAARVQLSLPVAPAGGRVASGWGQPVSSKVCSEHSSCWREKSARGLGILIARVQRGKPQTPPLLYLRCASEGSEGAWINPDCFQRTDPPFIQFQGRLQKAML